MLRKKFKSFKELPRGKRILYISLLSFFGFILFVFLTAEFTSRPKFCTTCHYMQAFYDSWASSSHKDVPCAKCHFAPGFKSVIETKTIGIVHLVTYVTNFYKKTKPMAEISDLSCLRSGCHETRLLHGRVKFKKVYFDHKPHLTSLRRGKKLRCTSCHSQIVQGNHMKVTESTCFICHFKSGPGDPKIHNCTFCHDAPTRENGESDIRYDHSQVVEQKIECERCHTEMIVGDGAVPLENCYNCHIEPERLEHYQDSDLMHKNHITDHKIECQQCHTLIQHKLPEKDELHLLDCSGCHVQPHEAQITLFRGTGGFNAHEVPNPMFSKSITCKGCHIFHSDKRNAKINGDTYRARPESCEECHGKGFGKLLLQWKNIADKKLSNIEADFKIASRAISQSSSRKKVEALKLLNEAGYNIEIVKVGKSVHNVQFADELLRGAHGLLEKALNLIGSSEKLNPYPQTSKAVPAECNTCHVEVVSEPKEIYGLKFSHQNHVVKRGRLCKDCHSNDRKHGELILSKSKCAACHHETEMDRCGDCHELQAAIYKGTSSVPNIEIEPSVMAEAEIECEGCHNMELNNSIKPTLKSCQECHEEDEYLESLDNWKQRTDAALKSIDEWFYVNRKMKFTEQQNETIKWVKDVIKTIETDNSKGAHNPQFYDAALKACLDELKQIKQLENH